MGGAAEVGAGSSMQEPDSAHRRGRPAPSPSPQDCPATPSSGGILRCPLQIMMHKSQGPPRQTQ